LFILCFSVIFEANAQDTLHIEKVVELGFTWQNFSSDGLENLYFTTENQNFIKYNIKTGEKINFSRRESFSWIECRNAMQLFCFSQNDQKITRLNRYLSELDSWQVPEELGYWEMATPSSDGDVWAYDLREFALKKINKVNLTTQVAIFLNTILPCKAVRIIFLREYQNKVWLIVENCGVYAFDLYGNLAFSEQSNWDWIGFEEDNVYAFDKKNHRLQILNLKDNALKNVMLPKNITLTNIIYWQNKWLGIANNKLYEFNSISK
jgi:hypothetical protein